MTPMENKFDLGRTRLYQISVPLKDPLNFVHIYLYEVGNDLLLIDAGIDDDAAWDSFMLSMDRLGLQINRINRIVLTHTHPDHIGLLNRVNNLLSIPVEAHPKAAPVLKRDLSYYAMRQQFFRDLYREMGCGGFGEQNADKMNANNYFRFEGSIQMIREGDTIGTLEVVEIPGHSPDHIGFYDRQSKIFIAGDHVLSHISSNAFIEPKADGSRNKSLSDYRVSLLKCIGYDVTTVFTGHGECVPDLPYFIRTRVKRIREKAESLSLRLKTPKTASDLAQEVYPDRYHSQFRMVMSEIIGFLDLMEEDGLVTKTFYQGVWIYRSESPSA